ncbi:hypothetical protein BUALT_Bualt16G0086900 [Buddleja alternifolia]|uniref:Reticulon-like protein n=1 Tax=Buddleja alternifolia TaxID=168488 RepID=A0AAV6WAT8_9LAMI|nr:hypothetical protein BUALT_Bualt16G0086900 [Buddleja alternifolia]
MSSKEAMDLSGSSRRRGSAPKAGSVWESRMKLDEVKGGIKVLIATHDTNPPEQTNTTNNNTTPSTTTTTTSVNNSPDFQMDKKVNPKQSPVGKRKTWKSESCEGSPVQIARHRSKSNESPKESSQEPSVVSIKKTSSVKRIGYQSSDGNGRNGVRLRKVKSDSTEEISKKNKDNIVEDVKNCEIKSRSDEECEEKVISSNVAEIKKIPSSSVDNNGDFVDGEKDEDDDKKIPSSDDDHCVDGEEDEDENENDDKEIEVVKKSVDIKEISSVQERIPKKIVIEEKKLIHSNEKQIPVSSIVKKQANPSTVNHAKIHPIPAKNKLVDLVMWRDASKSAFVFGIGTFVIISSSYTKDLNISFISVVSYLGLVYLAAIFLFRSLITRGSIDMENTNQDYVIGEEEAIWLIKLLLPYANEFLLKLRALFSGDPSTTMKLAVLLFILARCGSSITIWKMAKLGFIGVFTVPKVCSSYSSQLTAYGTFWIRRFRDAWESCSHKKAVGFAVFTLVWNLSSVVARIWAVFMLFVAFKYYQQSMIRDGWVQEEVDRTENASNIGGPRVGRRSTFTDVRKPKKIC